MLRLIYNCVYNTLINTLKDKASDLNHLNLISFHLKGGFCFEDRDDFTFL